MNRRRAGREERRTDRVLRAGVPGQNSLPLLDLLLLLLADLLEEALLWSEGKTKHTLSLPAPTPH